MFIGYWKKPYVETCTVSRPSDKITSFIKLKKFNEIKNG